MNSLLWGTPGNTYRKVMTQGFWSWNRDPQQKASWFISVVEIIGNLSGPDLRFHQKSHETTRWWRVPWRCLFKGQWSSGHGLSLFWGLKLSTVDTIEISWDNSLRKVFHLGWGLRNCQADSPNREPAVSAPINAIGLVQCRRPVAWASHRTAQRKQFPRVCWYYSDPHLAQIWYILVFRSQGWVRVNSQEVWIENEGQGELHRGLAMHDVALFVPSLTCTRFIDNYI